MYEAQDQTGKTETGTVMRPVDRHISVYANTSDEAEAALKRDVATSKLPLGKVYQVCPWLGNSELIRSLRITLEGACDRVFLDLVAGPYSELRRIRKQLRTNLEASPEAVIEQPEQLDLFGGRLPHN